MTTAATSPKNAREAQYAERPEKLGSGRGAIADAIYWTKKHYNAGNLNWPMLIYISFVHVTALLGVRDMFKVGWQTLLWAFILWPM